jgi:hypothetical protein
MAKYKTTLACGWVVGIDYNNMANVWYCPKHKAAPEMYQALKNIVERIEQGLALGENLEVLPARKALTKAEGK